MLKSEITIEGGVLDVDEIKRIGNLNIKGSTVVRTAQRPLLIKQSTVKISSSTIVGCHSLVGSDGSRVVLVGCTVSNGKADGLVVSGTNTHLSILSSTFLNCSGSGVVIKDKATAKLSGSNFMGCQEEGLMICGNGSKLQASNCLFAGNKSCGVLGCAGAEFELDRCLLSESKISSGAEAHGDFTKSNFENCRFEKNCESGLLCHNGAHAKLKNCTFIEACGLEVTKKGTVVSAVGCQLFKGDRSVKILNGASCTLSSCHVENSKTAVEIYGEKTVASVSGCCLRDFESNGINVRNGAVLTVKDSLIEASKLSHGLCMSGGHTEVWLTRVTGIDKQPLNVLNEGGRLIF